MCRDVGGCGWWRRCGGVLRCAPDLCSCVRAPSCSEGVPIVYYGSEQGFSGGNDPNNREPLWPTNFAQSGDLYSFLQTVIGFRKQNAIWEQPQVQVPNAPLCTQSCSCLLCGRGTDWAWRSRGA